MAPLHMKNMTSQLGTACDICRSGRECSIIIGLYISQTRGLACIILLTVILLCLMLFIKWHVTKQYY